jgi:2-C-methyl-D-erythritol 4-phosphate cytidylyltransferase
MNKNKYWAVIPAAGAGKRMQVNRPKQYLALAGRTVLETTLSIFIRHPEISGIIVAITDGDPYWKELDIQTDKPVLVASGGKERSDSVLSALTLLKQHAENKDWVLVHDAARPCLKSADINTLIEQLSDSNCGGLLGLPVADTVKRCNTSRRIVETVDRSNLWRALTPQMFRLGMLYDALSEALEKKLPVTDEASAIESQGLQPIMIEGSADNIKITHPGDLELATLYLKQLTHTINN